MLVSSSQSSSGNDKRQREKLLREVVLLHREMELVLEENKITFRDQGKFVGST